MLVNSVKKKINVNEFRQEESIKNENYKRFIMKIVPKQIKNIH